MANLNIVIHNNSTEQRTAHAFDPNYHDQFLSMNYDVPSNSSVYDFLKTNPIFNSIQVSAPNIEDYFESLTFNDYSKTGQVKTNHVIPAYYLSPFQANTKSVHFNKKIVLNFGKHMSVVATPNNRTVIGFSGDTLLASQHNVAPFQYMYPIIVENNGNQIQKVKLFTSQNELMPSDVSIRLPYASYLEIQQHIGKKINDKFTGTDKELPLVFDGLKVVCGNVHQFQTHVNTDVNKYLLASAYHPIQSIQTVIDMPFVYSHGYQEKNFIEIEIQPNTKSMYLFYKKK